MSTDDLTLSFEAGPLHAVPTQAQLVVVDGDSSWVVALPSVGELVIGRAQEAHVRVNDPSVSRLHLKLMIAGSEVRALDLGSSGGTSVNGERLEAARALISGDVLELAPTVTAIYHRDRARARERPLLEAAPFRARLEEELIRAQSYHRPAALIVVDAGPDLDRATLVRALAGQTRTIDVPGWLPGRNFALLLPEQDGEEALVSAKRLVSAVGPRARAGVAACPRDAGDADALIAAAIAGLDLAAAGRVGQATEAAVRRQVGDRTILLADPAVKRLYALVDRLAPTEVSVLINGETGAGKELVAQALHFGSPRRRSGPFVVINCAALSETLAESQLFGHEKGAFSGADAAKAGLIESAQGGTFFLDELGELSLAIQAKLLRVIETQRVLRLGDVRERPVDVRFVAATHRDLEAEVRAGRFRQDLYYRLATAKVALPPLRQRRAEIPILAAAILAELTPQRRLSDAALQRLLAHDWPGNVRELKNVLELAAAMAEGERIEPWALPFAAESASTAPTAGDERKFRPIEDEVRELERARMSEALAVTGGNQTRAAELISMPLRTFVTKLKQFGLSARERR